VQNRTTGVKHEYQKEKEEQEIADLLYYGRLTV
jgi:hypothetical protein